MARTFPVSAGPAVLGLLALAGPGGAQAPDFYDDGVLRTVELTFRQRDYWQQLFQNRVAKVYIKADLKVDGVTYKDVGVRFRGHSSWEGVKGKDKKPFKIAMDEFVPGRTLYGHRTLNLNNNFIDPTHMREPLAYWILRKFMPAPRANFVRLVINNQNWGLYINVEQINKDFLRRWFRDEDGNRYRAEWQDGANNKNSAMQWLGAAAGPYQKAYELKTEPATNPWADLIGVIDKLNNSGNAIETELPKVLDVDTAIRMLVGTNLIPLHDSYTHITPHNYYLYNDPFHGRFELIPWDTNNSFGDYPWLTIRQKMLLDPFYRASRSDRPLLNKIVTRPAWRQRFLAHFRAILREAYDWPTLGRKIAEWQKLIVPVLNNDPKRLYPMSTFWQSFTRDTKVEIWVAGLEPFIKGRASFLRSHAELRKTGPSLEWVARQPAQPTVKDRVGVTTRVTRPQDLATATLRWRVKGPFRRTPMYDDGKHGDQGAKDGIYGAWIPPQPHGARVDYYVEAANRSSAGGAWSFHPPHAAFKPHGFRVEWATAPTLIALSEFVARNVHGITDEKGEHEDWVELVNVTGRDLDAGGMYLTDNLDLPKKWQVPGSVTIPAWGTLLIWADGEPNDGPLHATFKLSAAGEELALFDRDGLTLLDSIRFGRQLADVSTGRIENFTSPWVTYPIPTPGRKNSPSGCGWRLYSALDPTRHVIALLPGATPKIGRILPLHLVNGPKNDIVLLLLAQLPGNVPLPRPLGVSLLFRSPVLVTFPVGTDAAGAATIPLLIPASQALAGLRVSFQALATGSTGLRASNGLEVRVCR